jgi:hypothetical protein
MPFGRVRGRFAHNHAGKGLRDMATNMRIKPGTYPSMSIQEGSHGTGDLASANWSATFGPHVCGVCKHFVAEGKRCAAGRRESVDAEDAACLKMFERGE